MDWLENPAHEVALAEMVAVFLSILHLREVFNHGIVTDHKDHPLTQLYLSVLACIVYRRRRAPMTAYDGIRRGGSQFHMGSRKNSLRRFLQVWVESFMLYYTTGVVVQVMLGGFKLPTLQSMGTFVLALLITHYSPGDVIFTLAQHDSVKYALNLRFALGRVRALNSTLGRAQEEGHGYLFQFVLGIVVMDFWSGFVYLFDRFMTWPFALFIRRLPKEVLEVAKTPATAVGVGSSLLTIASLHYDKYVVDPDNLGAIGLHALLYVALNIKYDLPYDRTYYTVPQLLEKPGHLWKGLTTSVVAFMDMTMREAKHVQAIYNEKAEHFYEDLEHLSNEAVDTYFKLANATPQTWDEWIGFTFKNKVFIVQAAALTLAIAEPVSRLVLSYLVMFGATLQTAKSLKDPEKVQERREWIIFWVLFQMFESVEETNFGLYRKLPGTFYFLGKVAFLHWLTAYGGAKLIYRETFSIPANLRQEFMADFAHLAVREDEGAEKARSKPILFEEREEKIEEVSESDEEEEEEEREDEKEEVIQQEEEIEERREREEDQLEEEEMEEEVKRQSGLEGSTKEGEQVEEDEFDGEFGEDEEEFSVANPLLEKKVVKERPRQELGLDYGFYASNALQGLKGRKKKSKRF